MPTTLATRARNCTQKSIPALIVTSILLLILKKITLSEAAIVWAFCSIFCIPFISWRNNNGTGDGQAAPTQPESQALASQKGRGAAAAEEEGERELIVMGRV